MSAAIEGSTVAVGAAKRDRKREGFLEEVNFELR